MAKPTLKKPRKLDYNMIVIGAGAAGLVSAYIAAAVKAKVALIERHKMGGDCLNTGCVPSKALIRTATILNYAKRAADYGLKQVSVEFDFATVMERVQRIIKKVEPHDSVQRYSDLGVDCIAGEARLLSPWEIQVGERRLSANHIVLATGARPLVPDIEGIQDIPYYTSDTIWTLRKQPRRLLVLGGGPIGCELAQAFQRLGCAVTLVERGPRLLAREDPETSALLLSSFTNDGITVLREHRAQRFETVNGQMRLHCAHRDKGVTVEFDALLLALGRRPNTEGFGLEEIGVKLNVKGNIQTDRYLRTNIPNIYACGDVAGPYQFTHTAAHQAWYVAVNALFSPLRRFAVNYSAIPFATYTDPEIAQVGLNEGMAHTLGIAYEITRYAIDDLDRAITDSEDHGWVKVLTVPGKDKILGVTIVGCHAGDIISEFVFAMTHGLGLNKILGTIHIYPTLAEANKYAAGAWKKAHQPETVLRWLAKFHAWRRSATH